MNKILGFWKMVRFDLPFAAGVCVVTGSYYALGHFPTPGLILLGFWCVFFLSASALVFNDYFDVEVDRINAPQRPIPSGMVTRKEALGMAVVVTLAGFLLAALISLPVFLVSIPVWILGFLYNWRYKRSGLPGNLMVAVSVAMTFIFGGLVVGQPFVPLVWFFALTAFLIDLAEEIAGDAVDMEGDKAIQSRSLALTIGKLPALRISAGLLVLLAVLSQLPFPLGWLPLSYRPIFFGMDAILLLGAFMFAYPKTRNHLLWMRVVYLAPVVVMVGVFVKVVVGKWF